MSGILNIYLKIILEFLGEFIVFVFLIGRKLNRRGNFALRAAACLLLLLSAGFGVACVYQFIGETVWGRIAIYLFLFGAVNLLMWFCFSESFATTLFCCSLGYAAQNFTYKLFLVFWVLVENFGWNSGWGEHYDLFYRIIYYAFFAAAVAGVYFLFLRRSVDRLSNKKYNAKMFVSSLLVLFITVVICSVEDLYFAKLATDKENLYGNGVYIVLRETGNVLSLVCLGVTMFLIYFTVEQRDMKQEIEYLQHTIDHGEWQYEMRKDIVEMVNMKLHDIKYRINAVLAGSGNVSDDDINKLQQSVFIYDSVADTGNKLLNVLFSEKRLYCEQNGIRFSCMVDGGELSFMSDGDLYALFGNILDNALEAVRNVKDPNKRIVNVVVKRKNNMLVLQAENYFEGELEIKDGLPETIKSDKSSHGFGIKSIRMIAHKYDGEVSIYTAGEIFHLNVIFSLN